MAWLWRQNLWMWSQQTCSNCAMLSSQYGTKSLRSVSGTVCESVLQPVETLGLKQMSVFPIRSLSHSEHRSCRVTRVWIKRAGQVWLLYKERTFIVEFPTPQMRVTRSRLSFDWFQWFRRGENSHACHTPAHLHARAHTHTHAHSRTLTHTQRLTIVHMFTVLIRTKIEIQIQIIPQ